MLSHAIAVTKKNEGKNKQTITTTTPKQKQLGVTTARLGGLKTGRCRKRKGSADVPGSRREGEGLQD